MDKCAAFEKEFKYAGDDETPKQEKDKSKRSNGKSDSITNDGTEEYNSTSVVSESDAINKQNREGVSQKENCNSPDVSRTTLETLNTPEVNDQDDLV